MGLMLCGKGVRGHLHIQIGHYYLTLFFALFSVNRVHNSEFEIMQVDCQTSNMVFNLA